MDVTTKTFLEILKAALVGKQADLDKEILPDEWEKSFRMAGIHNVLPLFYEAVYASPSLQQANLPYLAVVKHR